MRRVASRARVRRRRLRGRQREIERNIRVPSLRPARWQPESVWAVSMVRNEADVIGSTIHHLLGQGVAGVVVVDNNSTDSTAAVLHDWASRSNRVHIGHDTLDLFYQGDKISFLSHLARRSGAHWIIPFDADEHWYAPEGTLATWLPTVREDVVRCSILEASPLPNQSVLDLNRYLLDCRPTGWEKVAFRSREWVWVGPGNHSCSLEGPRAAGLTLREFKYRSFDHFVRKSVFGAAAVTGTPGLAPDEATHWRRVAAMSAEEQWDAWQSYCSRPGRVLVEEPVN